jgi:hypothetical protein
MNSDSELVQLMRILGYSPDSNEVKAEAKKLPLLEAVARKRLAKTQQTENA